MRHRRQVQTVHISARGPHGTCGITRDGEPSTDLVWPLDKIALCAAAMLRLMGLGEGD